MPHACLSSPSPSTSSAPLASTAPLTSADTTVERQPLLLQSKHGTPTSAENLSFFKANTYVPASAGNPCFSEQPQLDTATYRDSPESCSWTAMACNACVQLIFAASHAAALLAAQLKAALVGETAVSPAPLCRCATHICCGPMKEKQEWKGGLVVVVHSCVPHGGAGCRLPRLCCTSLSDTIDVLPHRLQCLSTASKLQRTVERLQIRLAAKTNQRSPDCSCGPANICTCALQPS